MGRPKKPVALLRAEGKSHYSKEELAEREASELKVDLPVVEAPSYLTDSQKKEFMGFVAMFDSVDESLLTQLDADVLARYVLAKRHYLRFTKLLNAAIKSNDCDVDKVSKLQRSQNAAFMQCQACASSLGMTITSRCKIVVPKHEDKKAENRFARFAK